MEIIMKINKRLIIGLFLAVAGTLLWANLSWAQGRGGGGPGQLCPVNQTSQDTWQGRGQGNPNCPATPGLRGSGQGRGANAQGQGTGRGPRGRGLNSQVNNPNVNQ
jgi:hypothetical protein